MHKEDVTTLLNLVGLYCDRIQSANIKEARRLAAALRSACEELAIEINSPDPGSHPIGKVIHWTF